MMKQDTCLTKNVGLESGGKHVVIAIVEFAIFPTGTKGRWEVIMYEEVKQPLRFRFVFIAFV